MMSYAATHPVDVDPTALDPVTVVIPAFNLDAYLTDAFHSVQQQSYRGPLTIIILDDGSTDQTLAVAKGLAEKNDNLQVHTQTNQGRAETRNRLLNLAETELVGWLDGDDLASPHWIEEQVRYLSQNDRCVAVSGQGYSMTASGKAIGPMEHPLAGEDIDRLHLSGQANAFFQSAVLVRKSAVLGVGGYDQRFPCAEDYALWLRLAEIGELANVDSCHLYYRVHATSANWTVNIDQRTQGHAIMNEARVRRGLQSLAQPTQEIPPPKKDDWNRRVYWINIALKSGNPLSAAEMLSPALRRHPASLVLWMAALVSLCDTILFLGNKTATFAPGKLPQIGTLPLVSCYRLGRTINRLRRRLLT